MIKRLQLVHLTNHFYSQNEFSFTLLVLSEFCINNGMSNNEYKKKIDSDSFDRETILLSVKATQQN